MRAALSNRIKQFISVDTLYAEDTLFRRFRLALLFALDRRDIRVQNIFTVNDPA